MEDDAVLGYWEWSWDEEGRTYLYIVDGCARAQVWLSRGSPWEDDEWTIGWVGRSWWDTPQAQPATQEEAMRLVEQVLAHPERFATPRCPRT